MADKTKLNAGIQQWNAGPGQFMQNWHNGLPGQNQQPQAPVDPATGGFTPNLLGENYNAAGGMGGESLGTSNQQALGPYNEPLASPGGGEQRWIANALTEWLHGSAKGGAGGWGSR